MKSILSAKPLVAAAVALGAVFAASAAHARSDVIVSIGLNVPYGHVQQAPVYVQPQPVYVQPRAVYREPQVVYYGHDRRFDQRYDHRGNGRGPFGDRDRDGVQNRFDPDSRFYDPRAARRHSAWGDVDRDGVPNKYDREPQRRYQY
jgi:hypothetical protein